MLVRFAAILLAFVSATRQAPSAHAQEAAREIPPPIGPYAGLKDDDFALARSFHGDDHIVMTHYFYWYDVESKAHLVNPDGSDALTTHPASMEGFSYKSVAWHKQQLSDMIAAGIDVVLPVYWGAPSDRDPKAPLHWSFGGLTALVQAAEELIRAGKPTPRIGLFYDTTTLRHNAWGVHVDLTTEFGKRWFYASIRDFFSLIPPKLWAMIDGRPIVVLYTAEFAKALDQSCIDFVREQFPRQFAGRVPYIVREASWPVRADNVYAWGGAVHPSILGIAEIGPGYDHSNVPGRQPLVVPRAGGTFYESAWLKVLRRAPQIVAIETWNEYHEGTDISESREYGRRYIGLTRKFVDRFKSGLSPVAEPGPYTGAKSVEVILGEHDRASGLRHAEHEDGRTATAVAGGRACRVTQRKGKPVSYLYFQIDDSFKWARAMDVVVEVEFFDGDTGSFTVQYDAHDPAAPFDGAYKAASEVVHMKGTDTWITSKFLLQQARFANSQNADADFRIAADAPELFVRRVTLTRIVSPAR